MLGVICAVALRLERGEIRVGQNTQFRKIGRQDIRPLRERTDFSAQLRAVCIINAPVVRHDGVAKI